MFSYIMKNTIRQKRRSILVVLVNCTLVILLNLYLMLIGSYREQLSDLAAASEIKCSICNVNGSMTVGLSISDRILRALEESEYVKDLDCSVQLRSGFGDIADIREWAEDSQNYNLLASGVNSSKSGTLPSEIRINYMPGWDETLFEGTEKVCVMKRSVMEKYGLAYGERVDFTLFYYIYGGTDLEVYIEKLGMINVQIVGEIDDTYISGSSSILFPFQMIRNEFAERQKDFTADSVSFYISNPLEINEFKEQMRSVGLVEINRDSLKSYSGSALYVQDGTFIALASQLALAIRILTTFFVPMCILLFVIGYVISYLLCSGRVKEFALMRALGVKQNGVVSMFCIQQLILVLCGNVIGDAAVIWIQEGLGAMMAMNGLIFLGYMAGTVIALLLIAKKAPVQLLAME